MKIYTMRGLFINDDNVFKNMAAEKPREYANLSLEAIEQGAYFEMKWAADATDKPLGDFIMIPGFGLASSIQTIDKFRKFAPRNIVTKIQIDKENSKFAVLQPKNRREDECELEHIFMMFPTHKFMLVSQAFKDEWENLGLTGADFREVAQIEDSRFIPLD